MNLIQFALSFELIIFQECLQANWQFVCSWLIDILIDNNSMNDNRQMAVAGCIFLLLRNIMYIFTFHIFQWEAGLAESFCGRGKRSWTVNTGVSNAHRNTHPYTSNRLCLWLEVKYTCSSLIFAPGMHRAWNNCLEICPGRQRLILSWTQLNFQGSVNTWR